MNALETWELANKGEQAWVEARIAEEEGMVTFCAKEGRPAWSRRYASEHWVRVDKWWWPCSAVFKPRPKLVAIAEHFRLLGYQVTLRQPNLWEDGRLIISWEV